MRPVRIGLLFGAALLGTMVASADTAIGTDDRPANGSADSDDIRRCLADPLTRDALTPAFIDALDRAREPLYNWLKPSGAAGATPARGRTGIAADFGSLGQLLHAHLLFPAAAACYRSALRLTPDDYRAHYYLGYLWQQQSQLDKAAAAFARALQLRPQLPQAALRLALIRTEQGRHQQARALFTAWRDDPRYRAWVSFQLGRQALADERYGHAIELLEAVIADQPTASRTHYLLAMAWRGLGDRARARRELAQRGDREPPLEDPLVALLDQRLENRQTDYHRAMSAAARRDYPAAVAAFEAGLAEDPANHRARISLARALFLGGAVDRADQQLRQAAAGAADRPAALALFLLGVLAEYRGDLPAAEERYKASLARDPDQSGAHFFLANRLLAAGNPAAAAEHYQAAAALTPGNSVARLREALAAAYAGAAEKDTLAALQRLHRDDPSDPAVGYYLARLLALAADPALRDPERAKRLAIPLYHEYPNPNLAELAALVQAATGDYRQASDWMQRAIAATGRTDGPNLAELERTQQRFEQHRPSDQPPLGAALRPPPADAVRVFANYPSGKPY